MVRVEITTTMEAPPNMVAVEGAVAMVAVLMEKVETLSMAQGAVEEAVVVTPLAQTVEAGVHMGLVALPLVVVLLVAPITARLELVEAMV